MTLPSNAGGEGLSLCQGPKIPHASWPKNQNIKQKSNIVPNSIKTKNGTHQKKKKSRTKKVF